MSRWFRHYAGLCRDEKLVRVALRSKQPIERVVWVWCAILESASEVNDGGRFDFDAGEAAYFLRADEHDVVDIVNSLEFMGRCREGAVAKWSERQFVSDTSAERQKRYRDRQKTRDNGNADGEVTPALRHSDAPETETETETDICEANASLVGADATDAPAGGEKVVEFDRNREAKRKALISAGEWWNGFAAGMGLPQIDAIKAGSTREKHAWARCREWLDDHDGLDGMFATLDARIRGSPLLRGDKGQWAASFDWIMGASNFQKVMDGNYEDRKAQRG